ncbi:MAG: DNA gyrase subunit A, partial [Lachnospiraceae bacterium]
MQDSQIIRTEYSDVMKKSYIDYAMSVIVARALPDVRDGLKPVQRRTLYDMYELGIRYERPFRKCARIVGDTMGKYHPHGDSSIYESLVVMSQHFKKGMVLVDGHGNFGSIEGDGAAAMRYTEARLAKITQEVYLSDLDKD